FESVAVDALVQFFADSGLSVRLPSIKEHSTVASLVAPNLAKCGWRRRVISMQVSPFIPLGGATFDAYLQSIGSSHRYNFRRRLRHLQKAHDVQFERAESDDERRLALRQVIDLHLRRWTKRGGSDAFHED